MSLYGAPQDEGYSEDPLGNNLAVRNQGRVDHNMTQWLQTLDVDDRISLAMNILKGLPTSAVFDIVNAVGPMLHVNFMNRLPPEVCLKVLGFLDPVSLVQMAQASRGCMSLSLDWTLWQQLYYREGWSTNNTELRLFEKQLADESPEHRPIVRTRPSVDLAPPRKKTKPAGEQDYHSRSQDDDTEMSGIGKTAPTAPLSQQTSLFGGSTNHRTDTESQDHEVNDPMSFGLSHGDNKQSSPDVARQNSVRLPKAAAPSDLASMSSLVVFDSRDNKRRLNWQYLYTQRRRLEANWESEKFVNFQLPHPDHPDEAHKECIYTIQHDGKYLVSGSRDRTLRVWNLNTRRLTVQPLEGHSGSVLCLQFDADPAEDIIVSGSSDATVRIWRFSTGKILQVLRRAHREPILNVRFDRHIMVTCSKDKTIKIFNRRTLYPGELGYPDLPEGMFKPVPTVLNNYGYNPSPHEGLAPKPPFTVIGVLEGHGAAVNAVQIRGREIVSASGDRNAKIWDWPTQVCTRSFIGHNKGIACVQYDGRRVVTGSSDNEIKVFDKETSCEVASLRAHSSLVRTVQAGFGDLPSSTEDDRQAAQDVDSNYFRALDSGEVSRGPARKFDRNAGSTDPKDIIAYGAKLPPGGGGGRYGRIVSGSYDETVIIWRRDKEGIWKAQHTLRQADAARAALLEFEASRRQAIHQPLPPINEVPGSPAFFHALIDAVMPLGAAGLRQAIYQYPQLLQVPRLLSAILAQPNESTRSQMRALVQHAIQHHRAVVNQWQHNHPPPVVLPPGTPTPLNTPQASTLPQSQQAQQVNSNGSMPDSALGSAPLPTAANSNNAAAAATGHQQASLATQTAQLLVQQQQQAQQQQAQLAQYQQAQQAALANAMATAVNPAPAQGNNGGSMARVFKLQFDARRIICCSQTPIIVGWDFANRDKLIEDASPFFGTIE